MVTDSLLEAKKGKMKCIYPFFTFVNKCYIKNKCLLQVIKTQMREHVW